MVSVLTLQEKYFWTWSSGKRWTWTSMRGSIFSPTLILTIWLSNQANQEVIKRNIIFFLFSSHWLVLDQSELSLSLRRSFAENIWAISKSGDFFAENIWAISKSGDADPCSSRSTLRASPLPRHIVPRSSLPRLPRFYRKTTSPPPTFPVCPPCFCVPCPFFLCINHHFLAIIFTWAFSKL